MQFVAMSSRGAVFSAVCTKNTALSMSAPNSFATRSADRERVEANTEKCRKDSQGCIARNNAGKRHISLKFSELEHYKGERGRRGNKLPRGFQKVDHMLVES